MNKFIYDPGPGGWGFGFRAFGALVVLFVRILLGRGPRRS